MKIARVGLGGMIGLEALVAWEGRTPQPAAATPDNPPTETINIGGACRAVQGDHVGVFDPASGMWSLSQQRPGWDEPLSTNSFVYGGSGDVPLVGDWDGDGIQTQGVWRPSTKQFFLSNTLGGPLPAPTLAISGTYVPVVGDWDGNGTTTVGTYSSGTWRLRNANVPGAPEIVFNYGGVANEVPLTGDWDGDGIWTPGVYRPTTGEFRLRNSNTTGDADVTVHFGPVPGTGILPVTGDWNGDGVTTVGFRQGPQFQLTNSNISSPLSLDKVFSIYGAATAKPVTGNWGSSAPAYPTTPASLTNFFPLAIDQAPGDLAGWTADGINTAVRTNDPGNPSVLEPWITAAKAAGLKMIREPRTNPDADDGETDLLAWMLLDEPESHGRLALMHTQYQHLKAHNSRPVFFNFNGGLILNYVDSDPHLSPCNGPGDGSSDETCYPSFVATEDWVSEDIYPVDEGVTSLWYVPAAIEKLRHWAHSKPAFAYIETATVRNVTPDVTPAQLRGEIWSAIVHGVRGIFYFPFGGCDPCVNATTPANRAEMRTQNIRITSLATVLQTEINPPQLGIVAPLPLDAAWRSYGSYQYFFVLNFSDATVTDTMRVCGITPSQPITVLGEDRPPVGRGGSDTFWDTFAPWETHIYRISTAGAPPTSGLVAYWKFNEGSGTTTADSTTPHSNGTLLGNPTWTTGTVEGALQFNGSTSRVDIGNPSELQLTGAMTVSAWVYINSFATNGLIVHKEGATQGGWSLKVASSGVATMQVATNDTTHVSVNSGLLPTNRWVHLTGTYDPGAALRLYVNGALAGQKTSGVPPSQYNSTLGVLIGRRADGQGAWDGKIDDVRIYNRVLTLREIQAVAR